MKENATPVLVLAFHFPPATESGAARPYRLYKYLPEFGYQPYVITSAADRGMPFVHSVAAQIEPNTVSGFSERVLRKLVFPYDDAVLWSIPCAREARRWALEVPFRAILSTFPPINTHLAAASLKKSLRVPWIADFRDPLWWAGIRDSPGLPGLTDRRLEQHFVKNADALICVTDVVREKWVSRYPHASGKFHLLWNGYDPAESLSPKATRGQVRVLAHVGALYYGRRPTALLDSLARLIGSGRLDPTGFRIEFTGSIDPAIRPDQSDVFDFLESKGCLQLKPSVSRNEAHTLIESADYLLLLDLTAGAAGFTVPAKLYEYVLVGRPILAFTEADSPVEKILSRSGILHSLIYKDDSAETVDDRLMSFLQFPSDPKPPSEWFLNEFDGRRQAGKLAHLLDTLTKKGGHNS
jgi:glycosyltransferase involved in cell wall biosynthesis